MISICHISDTHETHRKLHIPYSDILIHSGDFTFQGDLGKVKEFLSWFDAQQSRYRVLIAGNHDKSFHKTPDLTKLLLSEFPEITYLENSGTEIEGIKIWGSPYTPTFGHGWAFNCNIDKIQNHWDLIPTDTQILVTHGPPFGILDKTAYGDLVGCESLLQTVKKIKPELHLFGHIHEGYGLLFEDGITFSNGCNLDERYIPINMPRIIEL